MEKEDKSDNNKKGTDDLDKFYLENSIWLNKALFGSLIIGFPLLINLTITHFSYLLFISLLLLSFSFIFLIKSFFISEKHTYLQYELDQLKEKKDREKKCDEIEKCYKKNMSLMKKSFIFIKISICIVMIFIFITIKEKKYKMSNKNEIKRGIVKPNIKPSPKGNKELGIPQPQPQPSDSKKK